MVRRGAILDESIAFVPHGTIRRVWMVLRRAILDEFIAPGLVGVEARFA
jgi:hypothetical protein